MAFDLNKFETFDDAKSKILKATDRPTKTAVIFRKYLLAVLGIKFGHYVNFRDLKIGKNKREEWSRYVNEINDMNAIVPIVDQVIPSTSFGNKRNNNKNLINVNPNSLLKISNQEMIENELNKANNLIELARDNLHQAEKAKKEMVLLKRKNDKRIRQLAIDEQNNELKQRYLRELEEKKESMQKLMDETRQIILMSVDSSNCKPCRICEDRGKFLDPKFDFKGRYSNGMFRSIKHVKNPVPGEEYFEYKFDISLYQNSEPVTFYFNKHLTLTNQSVSTKLNLDQFKEPDYLPDAKTEVTERTRNWKDDIDDDHRKVPYPQTEECLQSEKDIKKWQIAKQKTIRNLVSKELESNQDSYINYNKFAILNNHKANWKVHKLANFKKDETLCYNDDGKLTNTMTNKPLTKKQVNDRKLKKREVINSKPKNAIVKFEAKLRFKSLMVLILNSKLFKEMKLKSENQLTEDVLDQYLINGLLTKSQTGLEKGRRLQMQRIISSFFESRYRELN